MEPFILLDITGSRQSYVPYTMLERAPVVLQLGSIPINLNLYSLQACLVSVSPAYRIKDSDSPDTPAISSIVNLGTSFVVTYQGEECEVRLGRKITVRDASAP